MLNLLKRIKNRLFPKPDPRIELLKKMPKNAVCVEIGTWKGDYSAKILEITNPKKLYLIDPYKWVPEYKTAWFGGRLKSQDSMDEFYQDVVNRFSNQIASGQVEIFRTGSTEGMEKLQNNSLDWIYIDGNHSYEFVKSDLKMAWDKTKTKGYITGDDYGLDDRWWGDGVTRAVDEFVKEKQGKMKVISFKGTQFIFQKIKE